MTIAFAARAIATGPFSKAPRDSTGRVTFRPIAVPLNIPPVDDRGHRGAARARSRRRAMPCDALREVLDAGASAGRERGVAATWWAALTEAHDEETLRTVDETCARALGGETSDGDDVEACAESVWACAFVLGSETWAEVGRTREAVREARRRRRGAGEDAEVDDGETVEVETERAVEVDGGRRVRVGRTKESSLHASVSGALRRERDARMKELETRRRPTDENVVRSCVIAAFVDAFEDEDALEYVAGIVASDVEEVEGSFEDALGAVIDAYDLSVRVEDVCARLRAALDERASVEIRRTVAVTSSGEDGVRRLASVVKIGGDVSRRQNRDSSDAAASLVGGSGFWEQEQRKKQLEEEERMSAVAQANIDAVELKRRKREEKAAKARLKAREAQLEEEIRNMEQLAIDAAYSKGASSKLGSRDISVAEFSMPHPRGGDDLLEGTSLSLTHGRRYGLVGRNGCGKSTLLRLLARKRVPGVPADLRIMYVAQDSSDDLSMCDSTAIEVLVKSDTRREILTKQLKDLQEHDEASVDLAIEKRIRNICEELKAIGATDAEERARRILRGLQFDAKQMHRPVNALSGGWRMRVSLARALFVNPDCLLLDEPTNHLDLEACLWLEQYLCGAFDGRTLVVVSHDRSFLDTVCTDVICIMNKKVTAYAGSYSTYEAVRDEQNARQQKLFEEQQAKKKQMQKFVDKHLHKGTSSMFDDGNAKKAKEMAKKMERMGALGNDGKKWKLSYDGAQKELTAPEIETGQFRFTFPDPGMPLGPNECVQFRDVRFEYDGEDAKTLFSGLSMPFDLTTRIALVGRNGAGKSTLMKLITGALEPTSGNVFRSGKLRVAYVTQHHVDQLDLSMTALEYALHIGGHTRPSPEHEQDARRRLGRLGISGSLQTQTIASLSGGQRSRVAWAVASWEDPHLLLLDEPTNHLDYESVNALAEAVNAFPGGVVFVSHDEYFIKCIEKCETLEVTGDADPGVIRHADDFDAYKRKAIRALRRWT